MLTAKHFVLSFDYFIYSFITQVNLDYAMVTNNQLLSESWNYKVYSLPMSCVY